MTKPPQLLQPHNLQRPLPRRLQLHLGPQIRSHLFNRLLEMEGRDAHPLARAVAFVGGIVAVFGLQEGVCKGRGDGEVLRVGGG